MFTLKSESIVEETLKFGLAKISEVDADGNDIREVRILRSPLFRLGGFRVTSKWEVNAKK